MTKLLELNSVSVGDYLNNSIRNVSVSINSGDKIALIGENGSGKSTLIELSNGTLNPTRGSIRWKGKDINTLKENERVNIGTLWQDLRLIDELSSGQNINVGVLGRHNLIWAIRNLIGVINKKECLICLKASGLSLDMLDKQVSKLSGGQRQRVAIARLLRQQAELILVDEPLANLDLKQSKQILNILLKQQTIDSLSIPDTCLISLHRTEFLHLFTRVIGLKKGRVIIDCSTRDINRSKLDFLYKEC